MSGLHCYREKKIQINFKLRKQTLETEEKNKTFSKKLINYPPYWFFLHSVMFNTSQIFCCSLYPFSPNLLQLVPSVGLFLNTLLVFISVNIAHELFLYFESFCTEQLNYHCTLLSLATNILSWYVRKQWMTL